jgi:hypothetical protein
MVSSVQGKTYLDSAGVLHHPWYQKLWDPAPTAAPGSRRYLNGLTDAAVPATLFSMSDSPGLSATNSMTVAGDAVDYFAIRADFVTYFVVHTLDVTNNADQSYTIRASARWTWNPSGTVDGARFNPDGTLHTPTFAWAPALSDTFVAPDGKKFTESTACEIVSTALIAGITAPAATASQTWTRIPPEVP